VAYGAREGFGLDARAEGVHLLATVGRSEEGAVAWGVGTAEAVLGCPNGPSPKDLSYAVRVGEGLGEKSRRIYPQPSCQERLEDEAFNGESW
jgi:hypothetical protein